MQLVALNIFCSPIQQSIFKIKTSMNVPPHHRGKVARLPDNLRHIVNTMLRDGATYDTIIGKVRQQGIALLRCNLTRWRKGGYQDWLGQQIWLEQMGDRLQVILEMVRNKESGMLGQVALEAATLKLFDLLKSLDTASHHHDKPHDLHTFIRATNAICRVTESTRRARRIKINNIGEQNANRPTHHEN